jgi:hypothetical protein
MGSALPSNRSDTEKAKKSREQTRPNARQLQVVFGIIAEIHETTYQVKVRDINDLFFGKDPKTGDWFPLMNSLDDIQHRFGGLRKNLVVRIWYQNEGIVSDGVVEVVSDEYNNFLKKDPVDSGGVGVHKILSPAFPV